MMFSITEYCKEVKLVRDPIYKLIEIPKSLLSIVDHKLVQRLRWISQLPLEQLVYPSAQHSRFEHSIGVMYLSMQAAISLLKNEKESKLKKAFHNEKPFKDLKPKQRSALFVLSAGACGLLHDLGHAPFSHTLEESTFYTNKNINYNHEDISFLMAKIILKDFKSNDEIFDEFLPKIVLEVLNKNLKEDNISPLKKILRGLIDGPIDTDKGDYIPRDSYHCGVVYGTYDIERLWRHIRITSNWHLGVSHKGAMEAWSLRIARYKMYQNVYKHHVRNITDALLIDILSDAFDILGEKEIKNLLPIFKLENSSIKPNLGEEEILKFSFWTENEILKKLLELDNYKIKSKVERFLKRSLPKRFLSFPLEQIAIVEKNKEIILRIKKILKEIEAETRIEIFFIINTKQIPPVFTRDVQGDIMVIERNKEIPLAKYLNFNIPEIEDLESFSPITSNLMLEIFVEKNSPDTIKEIIKERLRKEFQP